MLLVSAPSRAVTRNGDATLLHLQTLPRGLYGIYGYFLNKIKESVLTAPALWDGTYKPVLGTLAVALAPLHRRQIAALSGVGVSAAGSVLTALNRFLNKQGPEEARQYTLYHPSFGEFLVSEANADYIDGD